jgi:DNA-binding IclR family transcriptional regulator
MTDNINNSSASITLVDRVADILEILADEELGISEMSRRLGLGKSTVHRLVTKLVSRGYIQQNPANQKYLLGPTILRLGLVAGQIAGQRIQELHSLALPLMEGLRDRTGETVTLSIKTNHQRVYLMQVESRQEIRQTVDVGRTHPLYLGGSGKAILAFIEGSEREVVLALATSDQRVNVPALVEDLAQIRECGYAVSREERIRDAASVAAPFYNYLGEVIGSMSVAGPVSRLTRDKQLTFVKPLLETAHELSLLLGAPVETKPVEKVAS